MTIGFRNTGRFVRKHLKVRTEDGSVFHRNAQGTALFLVGVFLVLMGWTWLGFIVETYGFWLLFKGFIPTVLTFFRRIPILGKILDLPILKSVFSSDHSALLFSPWGCF